MDVEKKRALSIFKILAFSNSALSSYELATKIGVTQRTIKSDIGMVRKFALSNGAVIKSKRGYGYWVEITDPEKFNRIVEQMEIHFSYDRDLNELSTENRSSDILRKLITKECYVKLEDIAEELHISRSSIKNDVKEIRNILESYNLILKVKPGLGSMIQGSEFDKRLCMLMLFEVYYHKAEPLFNFTHLMKYFDCEDEERNDIRHIFLRVLRESEFHIMDQFTQRISMYLILLRNRYKARFHITFNAKDKILLHSFKQYKIASDIVDSLKKYEGYDVDENEILALEVLLLIWADIDSTSDMAEDYNKIYGQALSIAEGALKKINDEYSVQLFTSETDKRIFISGLIPVILRIRFKCEKNDLRLSVLDEGSIHTSPVSFKLAHCVIEMLNQKYDTRISFSSYIIIACRIYIIINKIKFDFKPIRMIICCNDGIEAARSIKNVIINMYGDKYFEKTDFYELYEMRALKYEDYDAVALSYPYFSYKYEWPYVLFELIPTDKQFQEFYSKVILQGYQLKYFLDFFNFNKNFVFRDFDFESMESFIKLISFKHGKGLNSIRNIENEFNDSNPIEIYNKTCVLFINNKDIGHSIFEIYQLSEIKTVCDKEISHIIVLSVDFNNSHKALRFIEQLTHELVFNKENIYLLTESENINNIIDIVRKGLNSQPISLI